MSVQVEEIEILVKANIKDALAGMTQLRSELKKVLSAQLPNIQAQIAPAKQILDQYGNTIYSSAKKAQTATQGAGDAIKRNAQTAKQAAAAEKAALEAVPPNVRRSTVLFGSRPQLMTPRGQLNPQAIRSQKSVMTIRLIQLLQSNMRAVRRPHLLRLLLHRGKGFRRSIMPFSTGLRQS